jgi:phage terminase small subunit
VAAPDHLPSSHRPIWEQVVARFGAGSRAIEGPALEAYVGQVALLREAQGRVDREGLVVSDPKGNPVPHPAIAVARAAQAEIRAWGDRFDPQPL